MVDDLSLRAQVRAVLRTVPDFPTPGILFRDITPLLAASTVFPQVVGWLADRCAATPADRIACIESRGFLFGAPLAARLQLPLVPIRKPGKLPHATLHLDYELEYGATALEIHADACRAGEQVVVVDDLLASGGTAAAACELVEQLGATVAAALFVIELADFNGRERMGERPCHSLVQV